MPRRYISRSHWAKFLGSRRPVVNYCAGRAELVDVLGRMRRALRPGGRVLLQVAHAANVDGEGMEDRETGPGGAPGDVVFRYRFVRLEGEDWPMRAEYGYACRSQNEVAEEAHTLRMADASEVASCAREVGFEKVEVYDSWRGNPLQGSASPFVSAARGTASR